METLTREDARAMRAQVRQQARRREVQEGWEQLLAKTRPLMGEAHALLQDKECPELRELWLVLGVFEFEEGRCSKGESASARTRYFDAIAPRVREGYRGVSGFCTRMAAKHPRLLRASGNGYLYLTELGYALVQLLRQRNPHLRDVKTVPQSLSLADIGDLPSPRWRHWD